MEVGQAESVVRIEVVESVEQVQSKPLVSEILSSSDLVEYRGF